MPDRHLLSATPGEQPSHENVQQLIEAERGRGEQGVVRAWQASNSDKLVLTSDSTGVKISKDDGTTAPSQVVVDGTIAGGSLAGTYPSPTLAPVTVDALIPPGTVWAYGGAAAPTGWLLCNGATYPNATYPKLAAVLGTTYGGGGGNFNVPDLQGRVVLGVSGTHARGTTGGAESVAGPTHTHTGTHSHGLNSHIHDLTGSHLHGLNSHTHTSDAHTHGMTNHEHTLNGHAHQTNIDHGHGASTGGATGTVERVVVGTVSDPVHARDTHGHGVTVNVLGAAYYDSLGPSTPNTSGATNYTGGSAITGSTTPDPTGGPTGADLSGNTTLPNPSATGAPTGSISTTATDGSAPAAVFSPTTVATMSPFQVLSYIIRTGA